VKLTVVGGCGIIGQHLKSGEYRLQTHRSCGWVREENEFPMAKKKTQARRVPRAADPRMYGDGKPSVQTVATTGGATTPGGAARSGQAAARPGAAARSTDLSVEYSYVSKDLVRLGITAGALFVTMIVLGFIIQ
jgi:hypothetical protein